MIDRERTFFAVLLALLIYPGDNLGGAFQPEFVKPLANLTIPVGRDAIFTCLVEHLGGYRVGWVKVDTKAIQAIHEHVITHNPRVSVSHGDHTTWSLRIKGVQKDDEGLYMCQINTDPMKSQTGMLTIEVPPDFRADETSGDVTVQEGWHVKLTCRADGVPRPRITWRREDQKEIIIRESFHEKSTSSSEKIKVRKSQEFIGEELHLTKIKRDQMGVYHCIASNGVPPSISKRITVDVHFPPMIHVPNQLVGAPLGTDVRLECVVEASPLSINYWLNNKNVMIVSGGRFQVQEMKLQEEKNVVLKSHHTAHSHYNFKVRMLLSIRNFTKHDSGTYKCTAKNSGGDYESSIRLYEMSRWSGQQSTNEAAFSNPVQQESGRSGGSDSAESPGGESSEGGGGEQRPLDNTVQGHVGSGQQISTPTPRNRRPPHQQHSAASLEPSLRLRLALVLPLLLLCR